MKLANGQQSSVTLPKAPASVAPCCELNPVNLVGFLSGLDPYLVIFVCQINAVKLYIDVELSSC